MKIIFSLLLLCGFDSAHALGFSAESDFGSQLSVQTIEGFGDFGGDKSKDQDAPFSWNLNYSYTRSVTSNPDGSPIVDLTSDYAGGFAWQDEKSGWGTSANIEYSNTPAEQLVARGGNFSLLYSWQYQGRPVNEDDFSPYLNFKLSAGSTNYLEFFNGVVQRKKGKTTPVSGTDELRQSMLGLNLTWKPVSKWKFKAGASHYGYNRDVVQFENNLDSPAALQRGMSGFSDTVGGLPRVTYSAAITWAFVEHWHADFSEAFSIAAADASASTSTRGTLDYRFAQDWKATVGCDWEKSNVLTAVLAIVGIEWEI
jgi:hypothetical protein